MIILFIKQKKMQCGEEKSAHVRNDHACEHIRCNLKQIKCQKKKKLKTNKSAKFTEAKAQKHHTVNIKCQ